MGRKTIASVTLPMQIIKEYYYRLSDVQKKLLVRDLKEYLKELSKFGDEKIDHPMWMKFLMALDVDSHREVDLIDGTRCIIFEANDKIYPLHKYIENPYINTYLPDENIKKKEKNSKNIDKTETKTMQL
jgi:hypothetical protein